MSVAAPLAANPTVNGSTLKQAMNRAQLTSLPDVFQSVELGSVFRSLVTFLWGVAPLAAAANPWVVSTAGSLYLPDDAKALNIIRAYAKTGTGSVGALTVSADGAANPGAGDCAVSPNGDILFHGADAWTSVDVQYQPQRVHTAIDTLAVATNAATLPADQEGQTAKYFTLMEAQSTAGTTTGNLAVIAPGGSPSSGQCCLNAAKTAVEFASGDAVTNCIVKVGFAPKVDLNALLEAVSAFI